MARVGSQRHRKKINLLTTTWVRNMGWGGPSLCSCTSLHKFHDTPEDSYRNLEHIIRRNEVFRSLLQQTIK